MRRSIPIAIIFATLAVLIGAPTWFLLHQPSPSATQPTPPTPPIPDEKSIDIQHALVNRNDTAIGTPKIGNVFVDFSLLIMNCGYNNFTVAPSLFLLAIGPATYSASNATTSLPNHMGNTVLRNGQEIFTEVAYEIPADQVSVIPLKPLVYTLSQSYAINWVSAW